MSRRPNRLPTYLNLGDNQRGFFGDGDLWGIYSDGTDLLFEYNGSEKFSFNNNGVFEMRGPIEFFNVSVKTWSLLPSGNILVLRQEADVSSGDALTFSSVSAAELTASSGEQCFLKIAPEILQTSTASYVGLCVDVTESSTGSGTKLLMDLRVATASKFKVANTGVFTAFGAQINGSVFFQVGGTTQAAIQSEADDGLHICPNSTDGASNRNVIFCDYANRNDDYDHSAVSANTTVFFHSATAAASALDEWFSITHDTTDAVMKLGKGNLKVEFNDGNGNFWREFHIPATKADPGGSGATLTVAGASLYYLMDAITEYLYFGTDIHDDWDGNTDIVVEVFVALDGAETENDLIHASLQADYYTEHDDMDTPKTQTRSVDHNITTDLGAGEVHKLTFVLNWDEASHVIEVGDMLFLRFWLDDVTTATPVAAVRFLHANIKYRTKHPDIPFSTFPTEA